MLRKKLPPVPTETTKFDRLSRSDLLATLETSLMEATHRMDLCHRDKERKEAHLAYMERHLEVALGANQALRRQVADLQTF